MDLTNPSPSIGWACQERQGFIERGPANTVLALALIHHWSILNNVPLNKIAEWISKICFFLIIEFIPKKDPQIQEFLSARDDVFSKYDQKTFESIFQSYFSIIRCVSIDESMRTLYVMRRK